MEHEYPLSGPQDLGQVGPRQPTYVKRAWCIFESYADALDFDPFGRESRGFWVKLGGLNLHDQNMSQEHFDITLRHHSRAM
jgi:hypothetical protein